MLLWNSDARTRKALPYLFHTTCLGALSLFLHLSSTTASNDLCCNKVRSDTGYANHRTLHIPGAMWDSAGAAELLWAKRLCCIYTWVTRDSTATSPFMITYDGSRRIYTNSASFISAAESAYSAVCRMSMGSTDCARNQACINTPMTALSTNSSANESAVSEVSIRQCRTTAAFTARVSVQAGLCGVLSLLSVLT